MKFIPEEIENYCKDKSTPPASYLEELDRETHLKTLAPVMLSGHLQGRILAMLSKMIQPEQILEVGTFTGYSALCLAEGLSESGELHTIEVNDELKPIIDQYLNRSPYKDRIKVHIGKAEEVIPHFQQTFDLVFIDAGKKLYGKFYRQCVEKLRSGGFIFADNVLWSGKVLEKDADEETEALKEFNEMVLRDPEVEVVVLPIRDGVSVIRKK
nr:O-methyltransferase [Saprospiraceae bacterium]